MTGWFTCAVMLALAGAMTAVVGQGAKEPALFTTQQAAQGKKLYAMRCAGCHGNTLQGGAANSLAGPAFARAWAPAGKWASSKFTVDDLDFVIRTTMPKDAPGKLSAEEYTEALAFILQQNGYKAGPTPLRAGSPLMKKTRLRFGTTKEVAMAPPPLRIEGNPDAVPKGGGRLRRNSTTPQLQHTTGSIRRTTTPARGMSRWIRSTTPTPGNSVRSAHSRRAAREPFRRTPSCTRERCTSPRWKTR